MLNINLKPYRFCFYRTQIAELLIAAHFDLLGQPKGKGLT